MYKWFGDMHPNQRIVFLLAVLNSLLVVAIYRKALQRYFTYDERSLPELNLPNRKLDIASATESPHTEDVSRKTGQNNTAVFDPEKIPNIIHFVFGIKTVQDEFMFYQYLAVKAAYVNARATEIYLHYETKPQGKWLQRALDRKYITHLRKIEENLQTYGQLEIDDIPSVLALVRLLILKQFGGISLGLDVIALQNFDDLLGNQFAIGQNEPDGHLGLMSSFMMARNSSSFLYRWLEEFEVINIARRRHLCCQVPRILSIQFRQEVFVIPYKHSSRPSSGHGGLKSAFYDRTYFFEDNYVAYLWQDITRDTYIRNLTATKVWALASGLFCTLRPLVKDEDAIPELMSKKHNEDCSMYGRQGQFTRKRGLLGQWTMFNLSASIPRVPDHSLSRMHGVVSPLNGYDLVNSKAMQNRNFMSFRGGDHVYFPCQMDTSLSYFSTIFWLRLHESSNDNTIRNSSRAVILSLEYGDPANKVINLETVSGKSILLAVEGIETKQVELNPKMWYHLVVKSHRGYFSFYIDAICTDQSKLRKPTIYSEIADHPQTMFPPLTGTWLGRQAVGDFSVERRTDTRPSSLNADAHFDIAMLELFDSSEYEFDDASQEELCTNFNQLDETAISEHSYL